MRILRNNWPVVLAIAVLWGTIFVLLRLSLARNQGHLVYALDDGYVEMAIAKNFSRFGVWGVTRYEFASATSSILWPLLLAVVYAVFGVSEIAPLILNIICATLVVGAGYLILKPVSLPGVYRFLLLLLLIFLAPMATLVFTGMEHVAHILLTIVFAFLSAGVLARQSFAWRDRDSLALLALAPLLTLVRYEGVFLVFTVCVLLLCRRRVLYSIALGSLALAPVGIYGWISIRHGAYWLPNSLLLKGVLPIYSVASFLYHARDTFFGTPHVSLLMLLALCAYLLRPRRPRAESTSDLFLLIIFLGTSTLHLVFAAVGWFYRYEAYLVALGILVSGKLLWQAFSAWASSVKGSRPRFGIAAGIALLLIGSNTFVLARRGAAALRKTPLAASNIYGQQYQMATFLRDYYQGKTVAASDVGAINVLADIECLDVFGLASMEVVKAKLQHAYSTQKIYEMGKHRAAQIAIVSDEWLDEYGGAPVEWIWVGEWRIPDNVICRSDRVEFYAVNPAEVDNLRSHLQAFSSRLPPGVTETACRDFPLFELGRRVDLTTSVADQYLCRGWSAPEATLRWSDKEKALIVFGLDQIKGSTLRIKLTPFLAPGKVAFQRVKVSLNDQPLSSLVLTEPKELVLVLPANILRHQNVLVLELPDATSPALLGIGPDARLLAVRAEWMEIGPEPGGR